MENIADETKKTKKTIKILFLALEMILSLNCIFYLIPAPVKACRNTLL